MRTGYTRWTDAETEAVRRQYFDVIYDDESPTKRLIQERLPNLGFHKPWYTVKWKLTYLKKLHLGLRPWKRMLREESYQDTY